MTTQEKAMFMMSKAGATPLTIETFLSKLVPDASLSFLNRALFLCTGDRQYQWSAGEPDQVYERDPRSSGAFHPLLDASTPTGQDHHDCRQLGLH